MIEVGTLRRRLLYAVACTSLLGLVAEVWHARSHDALIEALLPKLSLSYEANVPTWLSASILLVCAITAGVIASTRAAWRGHWWGITAVLAWMSLDEAAELHENLGGLVGTTGLLYFDWVIPATGVVVVLAGIYWPFVRALPPASRNRLLAAAAVYLLGALVMELPLGLWTEQHGNDGLWYGLIDWVEETLELIGASLALSALVAHSQESRRGA